MSPGWELTPEIMPAPRAQIFTPEARVTAAGLGGAATGSSTSRGTGVPHCEDTAGRVMGRAASLLSGRPNCPRRETFTPFERVRHAQTQKK